MEFYYVTIICHDDYLVDCLQIDSEGFILFAEINQILLKISFIPIKGQLNSEWIYEVNVSPKMPTKNLKDFCPTL